MTAPSPIPLPPAVLASAGAALAAEFPQWEITASPVGMWTAYWKSGDGRHRRYIVAPSARELLDALREISDPAT
jgi:hypothetical protein